MEEVAPEPEASGDTEPVDGALMVYLKFLSGGPGPRRRVGADRGAALDR